MARRRAARRPAARRAMHAYSRARANGPCACGRAGGPRELAYVRGQPVGKRVPRGGHDCGRGVGHTGVDARGGSGRRHRCGREPLCAGGGGPGDARRGRGDQGRHLPLSPRVANLCRAQHHSHGQMGQPQKYVARRVAPSIQLGEIAPRTRRGRTCDERPAAIPLTSDLEDAVATPRARAHALPQTRSTARSTSLRGGARSRS